MDECIYEIIKPMEALSLEELVRICPTKCYDYSKIIFSLTKKWIDVNNDVMMFFVSISYSDRRQVMCQWIRKTTFSMFVAWMNRLSVFQIKVHNKYTGEDFNEDLRTVLRREVYDLFEGDEYNTLTTSW
ncbi:11831_t:CDS:2 [Diversispora eburnea]|uniref:11831_t:CDS:1 n=1 Tax=Diversispora eburnea TaxID=1213867 RepID=A0A9N8Z4A8_9GLOM|nr:11831_t:CDS:2 [Diversispora eburnea]